jgi:ribosomal protein L37AE/L43A
VSEPHVCTFDNWEPNAQAEVARLRERIAELEQQVRNLEDDYICEQCGARIVPEHPVHCNPCWNKLAGQAASKQP